MNIIFVLGLSLLMVLFLIFIGYFLTTKRKSRPIIFAIIMSIGLGLFKSTLALMVLRNPTNITIALNLFFVGIIIGFPIFYFLYKNVLLKSKLNNHKP